MSETFLVTGAAGFIGSRLAKALLDRGDRVVGIDNFNDYYAIHHKQRRLKDLTVNSQFTFETLDLKDAGAVKALVAAVKPTGFAHLAAMAAVRYSVEHPLVYGTENVQGTLNLLDAARQLGRPRVVLASTGSVYGADTPVPFKETASADRPLAPYPASKRAMELFAHSYHHLWKLPTTVVRFFNVYGPMGRPDMMPWQWSKMILSGETLKLYGGGNLKRDWTYIDDIVAGFMAALDKGLSWEIINLGCGNPVLNIDFVKTLERLLGKPAKWADTPTPASEPLITYADVTKAKTLLGYTPRVSVEEGLKNFVEWALAEKVFETE